MYGIFDFYIIAVIFVLCVELLLERFE